MCSKSLGSWTEFNYTGMDGTKSSCFSYFWRTSSYQGDEKQRLTTPSANKGKRRHLASTLESKIRAWWGLPKAKKVLSFLFIVQFYALFSIIYKLRYPHGRWPDQPPASHQPILLSFTPFLETRRCRWPKVAPLCPTLPRFELNVLTTLYLKNYNENLLFGLFLISLLIIRYLPFYLSFSCIFLLFLVDQGLTGWGFYWVFQLVGYLALSFLLERDKPIPREKFVIVFSLLQLFTLAGWVRYDTIYFWNPVRLSLILSGSCLLFLSLKQRSKRAYTISLFLFLMLSVTIGFMISPTGEQTFYGIPLQILSFGLVIFGGVCCLGF